MNSRNIHLKVLVPEQILVDLKVEKVIAEATDGFFCLKPRHIDFTTALRPGILYYYDEGQEHIIAVDEGILVKCGEQVLVSVLNAIKGKELSELEGMVRHEFRKVRETEQTASFALKNLEAELFQHFIGLEKDLDRQF